MTKLIVGLGNPGEKYEQTRHNAGFVVVDHLAGQKDAAWHKENKFRCLLAEDDGHIYAKPLTGMNLSGEAVGKVATYFKIEPQDLFVIHDDVDFPFGTYKIQSGRESAGHKGVGDIMQKMGTKDYWRIRVGIGRPAEDSYSIADYVLAKFSSEEIVGLKEISQEISSRIEKLNPRL